MDSNQMGNTGMPPYFIYYPFYFANQWPQPQYHSNTIETHIDKALPSGNMVNADENQKKNENKQTFMEIPTLSLDWSLNYCLDNQVLPCHPSNSIDRKTEEGEPAQSTEVGCKCTRTKCTKEYCSCFKNGQFCGPSCRCLNCKNIQKEKFLQKKKSPKCFCKKSRCSSKYCECLSSGLKCGEQCGCLECKNTMIKEEEGELN